jgi:hypothetical protein
MHEFERLGWHDTYGPYDRSQLSGWWNERYASERAARLDICSRIIGRKITSTRYLTEGEAGMIVRVLLSCASYDDLLRISEGGS